MKFKAFNRRTQYKDFENFLERLQNSHRILYVSSFKMLTKVPSNRAGVYISSNHSNIAVYYQSNKTESKKMSVA